MGCWRRSFAVLTVVWSLLIAACATTPARETSTTARSDTTSTSQEPVIDYRRYVEDAIGILQLEFWRTSDIEWESIREPILAGLSEDPIAGEAYAAIDSAVDLISDPHTRFVRPADSTATEPSGRVPYGERMEGDIAYLYLPGTVGLSDHEFISYASTVADALRAAERFGPICGWAIDLRENAGGSLPQMLLGIGPLFGEGGFLSYIGPNESVVWTYDEDLLVNGSPYAQLDYEEVTVTDYESDYIVPIPKADVFEASMSLSNGRYVPHDPEAPIALLIGPSTASAGEAVLIGFIGRPETLSFGMPTRGVPTGVLTVPLVDGATLAIAGAQARDRNGTLYVGSIEPDERVLGLLPLDEKDDVILAAQSWLSGQCL